MCVCVYIGDLLYQRAVIQHQLVIQPLNLIWTLSGDSIKFRRLKAWTHKTILHIRCQSQVQLVTCASNKPAINQRFPWSPPWVLLIFWSGSQASGNLFTHWTTGLVQRTLKNQQPDEETWDKFLKKGAFILVALEASHDGTWKCFALPAWKLYKHPSFWGFYSGFIINIIH